MSGNDRFAPFSVFRQGLSDILRVAVRSGRQPMTAFDPERLLGCLATTWRFAGCPRFLNGRARRFRVGTKDAAISREGPQHRSAMLAVIEELAGICWHRLGRDAATLWTGNGALQLRRGQGGPAQSRQRQSLTSEMQE